MSHGRRLRSASKHESCFEPSVPKPRSDVYASSGVQIIPSGSSRLPGLKASELALLRQKQRKLAANASTTLASLPSSSPQLRTALEASLIFAQREAGSAVCVDPAGWVLTCAHCFGDTEEEYCRSPKKRWLLFYDGCAVQVECRAWDLTRDLALLRIVALENTGGDAVPPLFPFVRLAACAPPKGTRIVCIGQPGQDDLESASARRTKYNLVEVSEGTVCGMVRGADPQDNSEIGTLMHDAWTYWGHSGAPLIHVGEGTLVGLHSSWDDRTAMRHGVPHAAVRVFLAIHLDADKSDK
ncbi:AT hook domain-containing protein family protein [Mycena pura]|uniref:AT hook domain-containing protein family protein n=1 Tax=Mycena pura TaxID=153505 RepID=A0AAD6UPU3_9AGAR|nr:AT hook domain-containing protein family protein [Mycena pura]